MADSKFFSKDGIFCVRPSGKITAWGSGAEDILGFSREETIGRFCFKLLCNNESYGKPCSSNCPILNNLKQNRSSKSFTTLWKSKNGELIDVTVSTVTHMNGETEKEVLHVFKRSSAEKTISEVIGRAISTEKHHDGTKLTSRERQALQLVAAGLSTSEIGAKLGISQLTARNHVTLAMDKLSANNRSHAVAKALAGDLI